MDCKSAQLKMEIDKVVYEYRRRCIKLDFERNALSLDEIIDYIKTGDGIHKPIDFIEFSQRKKELCIRIKCIDCIYW